jgi:hypothetical protein
MSILFENQLLFYPLRMILVSAVFYGYYRLFLQDRAFHTYNRCYLLGSVVVSLILPLLRIPLHLPWTTTGKAPGIIAAVFRAGKGPVPTGALPSSGGPDTLSHLLPIGAYGLITALLLARLTWSVCRIVRAARKYPVTRIGSIRLLKTTEAGAPFSFLNWLFWPEQTDLSSPPGHLIFLHESYHIRQRHTLEILGLEIIRSLCWFNPFFHRTLRELKLLHEFGADRYALSRGQHNEQRCNYAELLVWQSMKRDPSPSIAHSFFHKQLKRRITMITQTTCKPAGPFARIMTAPLLAILLGVFTTAPAQDIAASKETPSSADSKQLARSYIRILRYPDQLVNSEQGGVIWFSVTLGNGGKMEQFETLDAPPQTPDVMKLTVQSYPGPQAPPMTKEEVQQTLQAEARRASEFLSATASGKHPSVAPGKYYFEISFKIEHKERK